MVTRSPLSSRSRRLRKGSPSTPPRHIDSPLPAGAQVFIGRNGVSVTGHRSNRKYAYDSVERFSSFSRRRRRRQDDHRSASAHGFAAVRVVWHFDDLVRLDHHQLGTHVSIRLIHL